MTGLKLQKKAFILLIIAFVLFFTACSSSMNNVNQDIENDANNQVATITPGTYRFCSKSDAEYLSFSNKTLMLSETPATWRVDRASVGFYVYGADSGFVLDIDNANVTSGTTIKLWEPNGYNVQKWKIVENPNGTYSFLSCADEMYCLGLDGKKIVLQLREAENASQEWYGEAVVDETLQKYATYCSSQGIFEIRLPINITEVISNERLQQWANDLEKAYFSLYELTNYKPYDYIIVEAYKPFTKHTYALGYVIDDINIIYIDGNFIRGDLEKMANRVNDWNFCTLHELGHMFDTRRPWNFEPEALTDIKISYVLEQNNAGAELSSTGNEATRYGKDIMLSYKQMSGDLSAKYDIFGCAYKFLQIKEEIGWEPFKETFHKLQSEESNYVSATDKEKFELFINTLSDFSGKNIKSYFTTAEWNSIIEEIS